MIYPRNFDLLCILVSQVLFNLNVIVVLNSSTKVRSHVVDVKLKTFVILLSHVIIFYKNEN